MRDIMKYGCIRTTHELQSLIRAEVDIIDKMEDRERERVTVFQARMNKSYSNGFSRMEIM